MFKIRVDVYHHLGDDFINPIMERMVKMSAQLDELTTEVAEIGTVIDSAIALLHGLSDILLQIKDDPNKIKALSVELDTKAAALSEAVVATTPAG